MQRALTIFTHLFFANLLNGQTIIHQDYCFLGSDGQVKKISQRNDTLYLLNCYLNQSCDTTPDSYYRIISITNVDSYSVLKMEQLDTMTLSITPYPTTRFLIWIINKPDQNRLEYSYYKNGINKQELDTISVELSDIKRQFYYTFYGDAYLDQLSYLKKVITKQEVLEIVGVLKSDKFQELISRYKKSEMHDMYGSALTSELLTKACIVKGFNPIGAGQTINSLMK